MKCVAKKDVFLNRECRITLGVPEKFAHGVIKALEMKKMKIYLESSAALEWLLKTTDFEREYGELIHEASIFSSLLTLIEVKRVLCRFNALGQLREKEYQKILGVLAKSKQIWEWMPLRPIVQERVAQTFPIEPIRTLDAIHLASAMEFAKVFPELQVLTFDKRIQQNLDPLGLELFLPTKAN